MIEIRLKKSNTVAEFPSADLALGYLVSSGELPKHIEISVVEQVRRPFGVADAFEEAPAETAPAPKRERKPRAPKAAPAESPPKATRAPKDTAPPADHIAAIIRQIPAESKINGAEITGDLGHGMSMKPPQIKRALAYLSDIGALNRDKRGRGGTWYSRGQVAA